jgi:hypothetical protein
MIIVNYTGHEHLRGARFVRVLASVDGQNFTQVLYSNLSIALAAAEPTNAQPQYIDLGTTRARAVKIDILENHYDWVFCHGGVQPCNTQMEQYAHKSVTGFAEIRFFGGSTASAADFEPGTLTGSVLIPVGQSSVNLPIPALAGSQLGAQLVLTLTSDNTVYSLGAQKSATVTIVDPP